MVTADGYALQPSITVPPGATDFTISDLGVVSARVDGSIVNLGTITLSMFTNDGGLEALGDNLFKETEASGPPVTTNANENGAGTMLQGFLEGSNVDPVNSITDLITAQRAYELNSRVITTSDEMLSTISQMT
jgi:flagellar basal-body rod protein FlgG